MTTDAENDAPTVCITHGRFIPCRKDGEHRYTSDPAWVRRVREYQRGTIEKDAGLRFRIETACDGYSALWESDVPDDVLSPEDYIRGAHDAAEAIRTTVTPPASSTSEADHA